MLTETACFVFRLAMTQHLLVVQAVNLCSLEHRAKIESINYRYAVKATLYSNACIASHERFSLINDPPRYAMTRLVLYILQREIRWTP
jgi:hypothetical protein